MGNIAKVLVDYFNLKNLHVKEHKVKFTLSYDNIIEIDLMSANIEYKYCRIKVLDDNLVIYNVSYPINSAIIPISSPNLLQKAIDIIVNY